MANRDLNNQQPDSNKLSHEEASELLHIYAHAAIQGGTPELQYPDVAAHLATCTVCQADLDNLLNLVQPVYAGEDRLAPPYPQPKLERLSPPWRMSAGDTPAWYVDRLGHLWLELSEALLAVFRPMELAGVARDPHLLYEHHVERKNPQELAWSLKIISEQGSSETTAVQLHIDMPGRGAIDQAGSQVTLHGGGVVVRAETDEMGDVVFEGVPRSALPKLRLEVLPDQVHSD
jgi:hypothetical protein